MQLTSGGLGTGMRYLKQDGQGVVQRGLKVDKRIAVPRQDRETSKA